MLPPEVWSMVYQHCTSVLRLRLLGSSFPHLCLGQLAKLKTPVRVLAHALNMAAKSGDLQALIWLIDTFQVEFCHHNLVEFPFAFALEEGHLHILKHFYGTVVPKKDLFIMSKSLPVALNAGHFETVEWAIREMEKISTTSSLLINLKVGLVKRKEGHIPFPEKKKFAQFYSTFDSFSYKYYKILKNS